FFKLHKIMYLMDYHHYAYYNEKITDFFYIRQKDGPYCVELGSRWYKRFEPLDVSLRGGIPILTWKDHELFSKEFTIEISVQCAVDELLEPLSQMTDAELKTRAYLTAPMKRALRAERTGIV